MALVCLPLLLNLLILETLMLGSSEPNITFYKHIPSRWSSSFMLQKVFKRLKTMIQAQPTATERKRQRLHELYQGVVNAGVKCLPTHFNSTAFTIDDSDFGHREILVSLVNLNQVRVVVRYYDCAYENTIEDKRNVIKTAKDIFDFYHELRRGEYNGMSSILKGKQVPQLGLYYSNRLNEKKVVMTSARVYDYTHFFFNAPEELLSLTRDLDRLTDLIKLDYESGEPHIRWDKEIAISKQWWRH